MTIRISVKKLAIVVAFVITLVAAFFINVLAGLSSHPIVYAEPPAFVERYAAKMEHSVRGHEQSGNIKKTGLSTNFSKEEALMHSVFFEDEPVNELLRLFTHPEKAQRVKMAAAFSAVNVEFSHNEESGFPDKRREFWNNEEVLEHESDIQNALFEALITSAEEGTSSKIPYTLAWWMPTQYEEKIEVMDWAAKHHPDPWVRRFCVFFVVEYGRNEEIAVALLKSRKDDPDYRIRKEVLDQRFRRFTGG